MLQLRFSNILNIYSAYIHFHKVMDNLALSNFYTGKINNLCNLTLA